MSGLNFIERLRPVTYKLNTLELNNFLRQNVVEPSLTDSLGETSQSAEFFPTESITHAGFIAQEVEQAAAEAGFVSSIVHTPEHDNDHYAINYQEIVVPLVKAVQEQQDSIEQLENLLTNLEILVNQCCASPSERSMNDPSKGINGEDNQNSTTVVELRAFDNAILYQNIPNPFGQETTINYYLPQRVGKAKMYFYDNAGRLINEINLTQKGNASILVKASEISSGTYSYSLVVDEKVIDTKKMIKNN